MIFYVKDITELKTAKAKMDMLLSLSPAAICEWRPGGELLSINEQFARMVGYTVEEVYAMGWKNLTAPEYQGDPDRLHEENALKGIDKTYRKEYIHKDGHRVPIYLVTEPIFKKDGTPDYYISYIQDLTSIVEYERLIDTILETIPAGLVIGDSSGRLYLVNRGYAQLAGKKKEELLEQGWVNLTAQEDAKRTKEVLERIEDGILDEEVIEKTYVREDGTKRVTQNTYRPIEYKGRHIAVCCTMDITPLKEAHEKLEEYIKEQKRTIEVVEEQKRMILELSTPILPVWRGILLAPLIGNFDSMRMQRLFENLLQATAEQKPRAVLLDLSGLAYVDTRVISEIVHLIDALRLLGTITLLVGIQPRVAQGLVRLGVDLKGTPSHATLAQGLKTVLGSARTVG
jgi:PAS domain S-box-containing protein